MTFGASSVADALSPDEAAFLIDFAGGGVAASHDPVSRGAKGPDPEPADPDLDPVTGTYLPLDPFTDVSPSPASASGSVMTTAPAKSPRPATPAPSSSPAMAALRTGAILLGIAIAAHLLARQL